MGTRKEKIIEISIKLFNEKGCLNTSTRHIADELGISVGNLYYYFKNKEEIIINIYEEFMSEISKHFIFIQEDKEEAFNFYNFFTKQIDISLKYRFISYEMLALHQNFPKVKKAIEKNMEQKRNEILKLFKHQIKYGYMVELDENEIEFLIANTSIIRIYSEIYWLLSNNKDNKEKLAMLSFLYFIKPYSTLKAINESKLLESIEYLKEEMKNA